MSDTEIARLRQLVSDVSEQERRLEAQNTRLRAALKEIQAQAVAFPKPRFTWFYDRAEEALNQQPKDNK